MAKKASNPQPAKKANNMAKTAQSAKPMAKDTSKAVSVFVDAKAMVSSDEGESIVKALCSSVASIDELEQKLSTARMQKGAALSKMTNAFILAAKADKGINLAIAGGDDKKAKEKLFDKLRAVLRIVTVTINPDGTETRSQAPWADQMFPKIGENKKNTQDRDFQGRETMRSNFSHRMREAAIAAASAVKLNVTSEIDKVSGRLVISGKAVRETFNQDRVVLDERQNFKDASGKDVNLKTKPSIATLARMGGAVKGTRAEPKVNAANADQVSERIAGWQATIDKLATTDKKLDDKILTALDNLQDAIDKLKAANEKLAAAA